MTTEHVAYPYLRPETDAVQAGAWVRNSESGREPLGNLLPHWDYTEDLALERDLKVSPSAIGSQCRLQAGSRLAISVALTTGESGLRKNAFYKEFEMRSRDHVIDLRISIDVSGLELQDRLELNTSLIVVKAASRHTLAPRRPGSRLWNDHARCLLEGGGGRLGMETEDFGAGFPEITNSPWYFVVRSLSPQDDFASVVRVVLNDRRPDILEAVKRLDATVLGFLGSDLVRHVMTRILIDPEFTGQPEDYDHDTVGRTVSGWIRIAFPGKDAAQIASLMNESPERFEAVIASTFGWRSND